MPILTENLQFLKEFFSHIAEIGAVLPTSATAADALAAEVARVKGPKRVLEVGAGTGAITSQLIHYISAQDELVVCEINPTFMTLLQKRFAEEATFRRVLPQTRFIGGSILDLPAEPQFDFIVSTLPFNNCPPAFIEAVLAHYQRLLKPGGVLSYIEYVGGQTLKRVSGLDPQQAERAAVYNRLLTPYAFRRDLVLRNAPPAWIHYLRFQPAQAAAALKLAPPRRNHRVTIGDFVMDSAVLPFLALASAAAALLYKVAPRRRTWWAPAILLPLLAAFFRDPKRPKLREQRIAYAASDGVVLAVEELTDDRFGEGPWLRIAVFLSLLDVHVNYAPVAGRVTEIVASSGGFAAASLPAAEHNNALYTVIEGVEGRCIVAQRVGLIARRIVNRLRPGALVTQGEKMGLIRFGSRTDVYLPAQRFTALVKVGDRVVGGVTPLAQVKG
ncbi:MAG: methyltransferase domain-containing protein [Caldilinea sp. CFX5]|nr:methyltransferase domain-containing protein [Caldilinea sp. CFX5]